MNSTTPEESHLYTTLQDCNIDYKVIEHQPVFTCEESEGLDTPIPGAHTKQLLMRDKKKHHYVLAIVMHDKTVDTKKLAEDLGIGRLSFASPPDLKRLLGVDPGAVTPFGLTNDSDHTIEHIIFDEDAWAVNLFRFHPLRNSATVNINCEGFKKFLEHTGHSFEIVSIPQMAP